MIEVERDVSSSVGKEYKILIKVAATIKRTTIGKYLYSLQKCVFFPRIKNQQTIMGNDMLVEMKVKYGKNRISIKIAQKQNLSILSAFELFTASLTYITPFLVYSLLSYPLRIIPTF